MTEAKRQQQLIIETLIEKYHNASINEEQLWGTYQRILEAAAGEFGVEKLLTALENQGIASYSYKSHVQFLVKEANLRRLARNEDNVT